MTLAISQRLSDWGMSVYGSFSEAPEFKELVAIVNDLRRQETMDKAKDAVVEAAQGIYAEDGPQTLAEAIALLDAAKKEAWLP
jgi:hypothetical protein